MGGTGSGRKPNKALRREIVRLRAQGLTVEQIGKQLGVSKQCVSQNIKQGELRIMLPGLCCRECKREICKWKPGWHGMIRRSQPAYCLACLEKHPDAPLGQRILSFRVNAGLSQRELGELTGLNYLSIGYWERGQLDPRWTDLSKLAKFFGVEVLGVESKRSK